MEIFDLVAEGWTKVSQGLNYTTYSKPLSSLTQKDLDLFKYTDEVRAFENNNIPSNFTEEVGDRVSFTYSFNTSNISLDINKRLSSGINSNKNYTHLVYKKRDVIKNDSEIVLSHSVEVGGEALSITNLTPAFVWVLNRNNNTFKSITKIVGNFVERNDLNPSRVTFKPLIPITNTNLYNPSFSDTSTPYTIVNAGTYTFELDLLIPHFVCGFFSGTNATSQVQLKLYHEFSSDNGTTWTTLQSFSVWNTSSYVSSFIFPLVYSSPDNPITNRRLRMVAVYNLYMHYLYVINISQPSGNINI